MTVTKDDYKKALSSLQFIDSFLTDIIDAEKSNEFCEVDKNGNTIAITDCGYFWDYLYGFEKYLKERIKEND